MGGGKNHNVGLRILLVVGAGGGTSQSNWDANDSATTRVSQKTKETKTMQRQEENWRENSKIHSSSLQYVSQC